MLTSYKAADYEEETCREHVLSSETPEKAIVKSRNVAFYKRAKEVIMLKIDVLDCIRTSRRYIGI